jgi:hypothetical protein
MQNPGKNIAAAAGCALLEALFILAIDSASHGKDRPVPRPRFYKPDIKEDLPDIPELDPRASVIAAVDTYCIVNFDFEQMNWQGWTQVDNTRKVGTFITAEDFAGLGGGSHGRLVPIEGLKSAWIGARPEDYPAFCNWPPGSYGYGNDWLQELVAWAPDTLVEISYHLICDTEPGEDIVSVGWFNGSEEIWATYSGVVDTIATHAIEKPYSTEWGAYYFFRFTSDGMVSDEDGLIDTDGAVIIDSITIIYDGSVFDYEDFESFAAGTVPYGRWDARPAQTYGAYSGLFNNLLDHDPCAVNLATVITFFNGSSWTSGDYPFMYDTPFCHGQGMIEEPCQDEMVASPWLDLRRYSAGCDENQDSDIPPGELDDMGGCMLTYSVYLDNPVENLVFHTWKVRSMDIDSGCPDRWLSDPIVRYYGDDGLYYRFEHDISNYVTSDVIQVAVGVVDMCPVWYGIYGDCAEHTPAPWFDNIKITRYATAGPQWAYQGADLFQDNFPSTDEMESYVRADMAADISPPSYPGIVPGDSVVVSCWAPNAGGLDTLGTGEARVYFHCNAWFLGVDGKPDIFGAQLEGNYGTYVSDNGDWTVLLCEPARNSAGSIAPDKYCVDLNDSLFTRGYAVEYYFKAYDLDGVSTTLPEQAQIVPPDPCLSGKDRFEFTCLPALRVVPGVLFVDDFDGRGGTPEGAAQLYFEQTFRDVMASASEMPDRYDVNQPSSMVGNSLGSRARMSHLLAGYTMMIWDSGDLEEGTIISGEHGSDKSDDMGLLTEWLDLTEWWRTGIMVFGDNAATDVSQYGDGLHLLNDLCGTELVNSSYLEMTGGYEGGGVVSPLVSGLPSGLFDGIEFYIDNGCPAFAELDVLAATGIGIPALGYPDFDGSPAYAGIISQRDNAQGADTRTEWFGFSFMRIRNAELGVMIRNRFLFRAWRSWLMGPAPNVDYTDDEIPAVTALAGNFPNPFNPVTRVSFSLKKKGHVSMRVYDVSGRLVRVLVDEVREAGAYEVVWDGLNNGGRATASGIYFCRMEADDYQRTVKMVLLR